MYSCGSWAGHSKQARQVSRSEKIGRQVGPGMSGELVGLSVSLSMVPSMLSEPIDLVKSV